MYFKFKCVHCGNDLKIAEEKAGLKARCPYCNGTVTVPSPSSPQEEEVPEATEAPAAAGVSQASAPADKAKPKGAAAWRHKERGTPGQKAKKPSTARRSAEPQGAPLSSGTDVPMLHSAGVGLGLAVVFWILLLPISGTYFAELFFDRGWVPFVEVILMGWAVAIVILKSRKLRHQRAAMLLDVLPTSLGDDISVATVDTFIDHVRQIPSHLRDSIMVTRIRRALEHFKVRQSNPEVASMLTTQSEIDASSVQSSYTMIRVLIWAIPILGFIGTVLGISGAVGGFSESLDKAQDIEVLKASLNNVTGGLAVAFDTTLVALCMSVIASFPAHSMQKAEEDLLNWVDEYCGENLLKRLDDAGVVSDAASQTQAIMRSIGAAINHIQKEVGERLHTVGSNMERVHDEQVKRLQEVTGSIDEQSRAVEKRAVAHQSKVERGIKQMTDEVAKAMTQMAKHMTHTSDSEAKRIETAVHGAAEPIRQVADNVQAHVAALADGIAALNTTLRELDGKQVVIQRPQQRGWWPFGKS